jgi:predicted ribosomally synthesized peptide with nif11-like leader
MEQIKLFIEKAKTDSELMAKLDALGRKGADGADEAVALAAEYGFTVTKEDMEAARRQNCPHHGQLSEEELGAVSGGGGDLLTQNRYDPDVCPNLTRTRYECVGFLRALYCDHYKYSNAGKTPSGWATFSHVCAMGAFNYEGYEFGEPI